ncbi:hypothetical protein N7454_004940 [Penicillium verhagenii]|nr:hypothetical protein N7454_004940 [Penicillium verhagenii]
MASSTTSASAQPSSSAASAPATSTFGPPLPEHISSILPGNLNVLPLELVWMIFDQIFMQDCQLTHSGLCSLRKLALTNKDVAAHIEAYLNKRNTANNIKNIVREIKWWNFDTAFGTMDDNGTNINDPESDVITGTIIDDCPDCFMWLQKIIPELDGTCVNQNGWSFLALAGYHASLKILKFFFTMKLYYDGSCNRMLEYPTNVLGREERTLTMIADQGNMQFLHAFIEFLGPLGIRAIEHPGYRGRLEMETMYNLCKFATPEMAKHFRKFGIPLHRIRETDDNRNAYHAAAKSNSIEFLDYLHANSKLNMNRRDFGNETPLHLAIMANRLDVVHWFIEHGVKEDYNDGRRRPTAARTAARMTTELSEKMLEAVLPSAGSDLIGPVPCGRIIGSMMVYLQDFIMKSAINSNLSIEEYASLRQVHEERALRKCHLIFNASTVGRAPIGCENPDIGVRDLHLPCMPQFRLAKNIAKSLGFDRVLEVITKYYGR